MNVTETIDLDMKSSSEDMSALFINLGNRTVGDLEKVLLDPRVNANFTGFNLFNYDLRSIDDRVKEDDSDTPAASPALL